MRKQYALCSINLQIREVMINKNDAEVFRRQRQFLPERLCYVRGSHLCVARYPTRCKVTKKM